MTHRQRKLQKTVRFETDVVRAAEQRSRRIGLPCAVVLANAARESLLSHSDTSVQSEMQEFRKLVLSRLNTHEQVLGRDIALICELLALSVRTYLNHTPELVPGDRDAASMSGRLRFKRLIALARRNLHDGVSILDDAEIDA